MSSRYQPVHFSESFVLHSQPYGESSLIISSFSLEMGKVSLLARGARGSGKKKSGSLLQPFINLEIQALSREQSLLLLTDVTTSTAFERSETPAGAESSIQGKALYCAHYLNELMMHLLPQQQAHPEFFQYYKKFLTLMAAHDNLEQLLRTFELNMLRELGYAPNLIYEQATFNRVEEQSCYYFDPDNGPLLMTPAASGLNQQLPLISGKTLMLIDRADFSHADTLKAAKILFRQLLNKYLGNKQLKSRQVYRQLYR